MRTSITPVLFIIFTIHNIRAATDYCKLCSNHIACNNTGKFASACPKDAAITKLTQTDINLFVTVHNQLRNKVAGGLLKGFSSATNMSAVVSIYNKSKYLWAIPRIDFSTKFSPNQFFSVIPAFNCEYHMVSCRTK